MCQQQQLFEIATKDQNIFLNKNQIEEKVKEKK